MEPKPAKAMDEPLQAHTFTEVRYCLMVRPCPRCGHGPMEIEEGFIPDALSRDAQASGGVGVRPMHVPVRCRSCREADTLAVVCEHDIDGHEPESQVINPGSQPSRIVDLAQWLSLFYLLVESAAAEPSRPAVRQMGYQAALCLAEAIKFYGDNELPPQEAFFTDSSRQAFREHPENFARQKLRDMQSRLPALPVMERRLIRDAQHKRRGWRFWRR